MDFFVLFCMWPAACLKAGGTKRVRAARALVCCSKVYIHETNQLNSYRHGWAPISLVSPCFSFFPFRFAFSSCCFSPPRRPQHLTCHYLLLYSFIWEKKTELSRPFCSLTLVVPRPVAQASRWGGVWRESIPPTQSPLSPRPFAANQPFTDSLAPLTPPTKLQTTLADARPRPSTNTSSRHKTTHTGEA